ncbi:MAG: hypothetical protein Q4D14_02160 [Bacteroidales bacterium]|nr:hypothetical protein [Bacteroidales bacterium]
MAKKIGLAVMLLLLPWVVAQGQTFVGQFAVEGSSGMFESNNIKVEITQTAGQPVATIVIYKVKFSPKMPFGVTLTIPNVTLTETSTDVYAISGNNIVPIAMGKKFEKYAIPQIMGSMTKSACSFKMTMGKSPMSYKGTKK